MMTKLKVRIVQGVFKSDREAWEMISACEEKYGEMILKVEVIERQNRFYASICFVGEYDVCEWVLNRKSVAQLKEIANELGVDISVQKLMKRMVRKTELFELMKAYGVENENIKYQVDYLFADGMNSIRKQRFEEYGIPFYKSVYTKGMMSKQGIVKHLLQVSDRVYCYAQEIYSYLE